METLKQTILKQMDHVMYILRKGGLTDAKRTAYSAELAALAAAYAALEGKNVTL